MFGVALDGLQMRFNLPSFLGQRVEAGNDGLLFSQRRQRDFNGEKLAGFDPILAAGPLRFFIASLPKATPLGNEPHPPWVN